MTILVVDVGTSSLRVAVVDPARPPAQAVLEVRAQPFPPSTPSPGLVEFDAEAMAAILLRLAREVLATGGPVDGVGIANQRGTTIVWDRDTGRPVGPALGWQDLRTIGECLAARAEHGLALAPNQTATKAAWLFTTTGADPQRCCVGTVDSWVVWTLTERAAHVTDHTNAGITGLAHHDLSGWSKHTCDLLGIPIATLPRIVDSSGFVADATALPGSPPIVALAGDQQSSLAGQACVRPGMAKITFGTGGMLDMVSESAPASGERMGHGAFPIAAWSRGGKITWGTEAIMLSAGTNVEWLRDDVGLIASAADSHVVAMACPSSDGVVYVPALLGLGSPYWDYGARGALFGLTRGTGRSHIVRAVLEGVAHRGADLVEAVEADTGTPVTTVRVDGGMSANPTFVQALADATGRPVEVSPVAEATTLGAAYLGAIGLGQVSDHDELTQRWAPAATVAPQADPGGPTRAVWADAVRRSRQWIPELSALDF